MSKNISSNYFLAYCTQRTNYNLQYKISVHLHRVDWNTLQEIMYCFNILTVINHVQKSQQVFTNLQKQFLEQTSKGGGEGGRRGEEMFAFVLPGHYSTVRIALLMYSSLGPCIL